MKMEWRLGLGHGSHLFKVRACASLNRRAPGDQNRRYASVHPFDVRAYGRKCTFRTKANSATANLCGAVFVFP